jgi:deoxyribose-phosphate aldolase
MQSPAPYIDHTLLKPDATAADIARLCEEAVEYGFAAVCVPPRFVADAAARLYGSGCLVATVIGFPLGYETTAVKVCQAQAAMRAGARELDMVIQLGAARAGDYAEVSADVRAVVAAAAGLPVKVILETCLFDAAVQADLVEAVVAAGAPFVKTSTGFAAGGATLTDVRQLVAVAAGRVRVKASGGVRDWPFCAQLLNAGALRIGTSAGVTIMRQWHEAELGP